MLQELVFDISRIGRQVQLGRLIEREQPVLLADGGEVVDIITYVFGIGPDLFGSHDAVCVS